MATLSDLTYTDVLELIANYYKTDVPTIEAMFAKYDVDVTNVTETFKMLDGTGYSLLYNSDGTVRSYLNSGVTYSTGGTAGSIASEINSNTASQVATKTATKVNIPLNTASDTAGKVTITGGLKTAGNFVMKEVIPAVAAAGVGITLGKTIDSVLYNANPDFWDSIGMSTLDPDMWGSITSESDSLGATAFNLVYGIDPDTNETQAYLDENALAYIAYYMQENGVFSKGNEKADIKDRTGLSDKTIANLPISLSAIPGSAVRNRDGSIRNWNFVNNAKYFILTRANSTTSTYMGYWFSNSSISVKRYDADTGKELGEYGNQSTVINGKTVYYGSYGFDYNSSNNYEMPATAFNIITGGNGLEYGYVCLYGDVTEDPTIEGIGTQDGATTPNLDGATSVDDVLSKLKEQYPELWDNAVTQDVVQPDGTTTTYVYVPIGSGEASGDTDTQPTTGNQTQDDTAVNPDTSTESLIELIQQLVSKIPTPTDTNTDTDTGTGDTPTVVVPTGSASALYAIYNPTQEQLNSFGAWLWSSDFVDQLLKLFNDPMQAIIGLHKVYCPVPVAGSKNIKVGYLDSGVSSNYVGSQYVTISCGSVSLPEKFGNVFDYDPFTKVFIYLPFIGIEQLNTGDVMRSTISVTYHCDVLTGACLAEINVSRDGGGGIIYTYTGNCAVQYPISSGSYMGIVESMAGIGASIVGTVASGGSLAPVALGAMGSLMNAHTTVSHSGAFSGNAGAMGVKTPYLIITRPQTELAGTFPALDGYPANYSTTVGSCSGYIEIESVHVENVPATDGELSEIEMLLKSGVIV